MAKSKFFRVAVEGATTDGRVIERSWIQDMADGYNPETYGARINLEHIRGVLPDSPFKAYGDVAALKAEEITEGALKGKLALLAQIVPTEALVAMTKARQKIYTSCEIATKFAATAKAYLVGLAVTDSPASLGTEVLSFAAQHPEANPFAARKQSPDNVFSVGEQVEIEWEDEPADTNATALFAAVKAKLSKLAGKGKTHDGQFAEVAEALQSVSDTLEHFAADSAAVSQRFADQVTALTGRLDTIEAAGKKATADFAALRAELESTSTSPSRPPATGGGDNQLTDC
ncbi:MAG: GPO family capsid scaffolding protein [Rhodanobacter sp.]